MRLLYFILLGSVSSLHLSAAANTFANGVRGYDWESLAYAVGTALVGADQPKSGGQKRQDRVPDPQVGAERIGEDEGGAVGVALIGDMERQARVFHAVHCRSPLPQKIALCGGYVK